MHVQRNPVDAIPGTLVFVCDVDVDVWSKKRMVLASFGFLGVSARPPQNKNGVLVISIL